MHRRDFVRYMAALGLVSGAGRLVLPEEVWAMAQPHSGRLFWSLGMEALTFALGRILCG